MTAAGNGRLIQQLSNAFSRGDAGSILAALTDDAD